MKNKASKTNLESKGKILLFDRQLIITGKYQRKNPASDTPAAPQNFHHSKSGYRYIPSAQNQGHMLASSSNWGDNRRIQHHNPINNNPGLLDLPPALELSQYQKNVVEINTFMCATANICEKLQSGLQNPDIFISNFNAIMINNGYQEIKIPDEILNISRNIYKNNSTEKEVNRFLADLNFHNPQILQGHPSSKPTPSTTSTPSHTSTPTPSSGATTPITTRPPTPTPMIETALSQTNNTPPPSSRSLTINSPLHTPTLYPLDTFTTHFVASPTASSSIQPNPPIISTPPPHMHPSSPQHVICISPNQSHSQTLSQQLPNLQLPVSFQQTYPSSSQPILTHSTISPTLLSHTSPNRPESPISEETNTTTDENTITTYKRIQPPRNVKQDL